MANSPPHDAPKDDDSKDRDEPPLADSGSNEFELEPFDAEETPQAPTPGNREGIGRDFGGYELDTDGVAGPRPVTTSAAPVGGLSRDEPDEDFLAGEYELEPVDPEIDRQAQDRIKADALLAEANLGIDQVDDDRHRREDLDDLLSGFKFRFQVKHMLMATAALAVFLSVRQLIGSSFAAFLLVLVAALASANGYLAWRDREREALLAAKRQRLVEAARKADPVGGVDGVGEPSGTDADNGDEGGTDDEARDETIGGWAMPRLQFSVGEVLIAMTAAAVTLGLLGYFSVTALAAVLGLLAISGLVAFALGYETPRIVTLAWSIAMLLYIALGAAGWFFPSGAP